MLYPGAMSWLVTGGAGYIGSHIVRELLVRQVEVVVVDDLSTGREDRLPHGVRHVKAGLLDDAVLDDVFAGGEITGIVHTAAKKRVDESVRKPSLYYLENVEALRRLVDHAAAADVRHFLFSSSAAVYGAPEEPLIGEDVACAPTTPYGQTKLAGEWLVHSAGAVTGMRTMALRYFNVAGSLDARLADAYPANLVPLILQAIRRGEAPQIFGDDYPTPDGTCVRDYVHVADVAAAHVAAIDALERGEVGSGQSLNVGTGRGTSVREMVEAAVAVTGTDVEAVVLPRREGDSPTVVADVRRAGEVLGWSATRGVTEMVESAWRAGGVR